jgi:formylglycine-generating enzyme required for sulfatase activity
MYTVKVTKPSVVEDPPPMEQAVPKDAGTVIARASEAMDAGRYDEVVLILKQALAHDLKSRFIDLEGWLREAETALERQERKTEVELEYKNIAELVKRPRTRRLGCEAFQAFRKDIPNYDPENLAEICASEQLAARAAHLAAKPSRATIIPLLEWCDVPAGTLMITGNGKIQRDSIPVEAFRIAKYPVTNAQFQLFIDDPHGYSDARWWEFSPHAKAWRKDNAFSTSPQFQGDDRPRENVSWYEAMAYCAWLSEKLGLTICLPTRQQWQRAAKGDDNRVYPWGNEFDTTLCNTRESRIRQTTLVMRYVNGVSPYGAYDMAGNVWEWCLNGEYDLWDTTTCDPRTVQGGSFISAHERAQTGFHFKLSPEYHYGSIGFRLVCLNR